MSSMINRVRFFWSSLVLYCSLLATVPGFGQGVLREYWLNLPGTSVADLVNASVYPDQPSGTNLVTIFEAPSNWTNNYGTRLRGYVQPPQTGGYIFWISGDDQCELYLSSDEQPANKVLIASVLSWTNPRQWDKETNQQSPSINLTAGKKYYIEALQKEGGGGDCLAVGWQLPNKYQERPIPGQRLLPYRTEYLAPVIREQPLDQAVEEGASANFSCAVDGLEPIEFQWHRDGLAMPGETRSSLVIPAVRMEDDGSRFFCHIQNALGQTNSATVVLRSLPETVAPTLSSRWPRPGSTVSQLSQVEVTFSEPVQGVDREDLRLNGQPALSVNGFGTGPYLFQFAPANPGQADLSWRKDHQVTDLSASSNVFQAVTWLVEVDPFLSLPQLRLNEFLALNLDARGLKDEDGELQPWIELFNAGNTAVNLEGWSMSDDPKQPGKWTFPAWSVAPGEFVLVFASGKNRGDSTTGRFHTNFKFNPWGEYLGLFDAELPRRVVSEIRPAYPEQRANASYGLSAGAGWTYMAQPTPGKTNAASFISQVVPQVHFSIGHGCFTHPINLQLSCELPGATVRYTLDGSEPTETTGTDYSGPLPLSKTSVVRAVAFKSNCLPSRVVTQTYFFNATPASQSLPMLSLVTAPTNLLGPTGILGISGGKYVNGAWVAVNPGDYHNPSKHGIAWERPVSAELIYSSNHGGFSVDCGIRVHSSSWFRPRLQPTSKFSYRLYFRGEYGAKKLDYPLFDSSPVQSFDEIVVRAGNNDPTNPFIIDELVRRLLVDTGQVGMHGTFVTLFINGQYKGYFNPTERATPDFCQSWLGGVDDWDVISQGSEVMAGDGKAWSALSQFMSSRSLSVTNNYLAAARQLDLTNFVDYLLVNIYAATGDWPGNNWRAARERAPQGLFRFLIWDAEHAFGLFDIGRASRNVFANELSGSSEIPTFYKSLKKSPEFRLFFADRIQKHFFHEGALTDTNVLNRYNEYKTVLLGVIPQMNSNIPRTWIPTRRKAIFQHFATEKVWPDTGVPLFSQHGGLVPHGFRLELQATNTVFFTTNGADPRQPFTSLPAADAMAYRDPIPVGSSLTVKARALNGTNWSALTEASFAVPALAQPLRISEIMYHPPGGEAYEFVELLNAGSSRVDLSGIRINGLDFTFPAGAFVAPHGRVVLASDLDPAAFQARYPGCNIQGYFHGSLANDGEALTLVAPSGENLISVVFDDQWPWTEKADGTGASLEVIDPLGNLSDPANWRASSIAGGTPGTAPSTLPKPSIVISEIMAANSTAQSSSPDSVSGDWIELANQADTRLSLAGWNLSDGTHHFSFPPGTWIETSGFLLIHGDQSVEMPGLHAGFGLNRQGETLLLLNPELEVVDAISFGPQVPGYSIARHSSGWDLSVPTPAQPNLPAETANPQSVCLNEWLANPAPGQEDWIEFYNRDLSKPARFSDLFLRVNQVEVSFWPLSFIPPGGFCVLRANGLAQPDSIPVKLSAQGCQIKLTGVAGAVVDFIVTGKQSEGVSQGRAPDGTSSFASFPQKASPGLPNYSLPYYGPILNEILANPSDQQPGYIELFNPLSSPVDLSGVMLCFRQGGSKWIRVFSPGSSIPGGRYVAVPFSEFSLDQENSISRNTSASFPLKLPDFARGGTVELVWTEGEIVNQMSYGWQVPGHSIGLTTEGWKLLESATPGEVNSNPVALTGPGEVKINECLPRNSTGSDWIELYNSSSLIADLGGVHITDDPSLAGRFQTTTPTLSFIAPHGFIVCQADPDLDPTPGRLAFALSGLGESLYLYSPSGVLLDSFDFPPSDLNVSLGRFPDGTGPVQTFPGSPTPGQPNLPADLDRDSDGMPDFWELAYGLDPLDPADARLDSDQDGSSNWAEFRARTDPRDAADKLAFASVAVEGNQIVLGFLARSGQAYSIEYSEQPQPKNWTVLLSVSPPAESGMLTLRAEREVKSGQRFYRICYP